MEVVTDLTPYVDEVYPLYLQVHERSPLKFERLTKEYLCSLGQRMPERARFFIWRQSGKAIAFSIALVHDGTAWTGTVTTFLSGLEQPVPVLSGPDRAVYVGDWGTGIVYRIAAA